MNNTTQELKGSIVRPPTTRCKNSDDDLANEVEFPLFHFDGSIDINDIKMMSLKQRPPSTNEIDSFPPAFTFLW